MERGEWMGRYGEAVSPRDPAVAAQAARVRASLTAFAKAHPGKLIEVRVPPWAAVQVGVPGATSVHRRGTPPNVVEMDAATWLALDDGTLNWADAVAEHRVQASGIHADLSVLLG